MKIKKNTTLTPGRYCGGIDFQNGTATLQPGTYIMDGGAFKANGQASIVGNGVTIILTGSGSDTAYLDVNGGAQLSLHAPKTGTAYNGVLFFQDTKQDAKAGQCNPGQVNTNNLNGGASMDLSGAMYFPNQMLRYSGGTSTNILCLQMVALRVQFSGNSKVTSTCDSNSCTQRIARTSIKLTEEEQGAQNSSVERARWMASAFARAECGAMAVEFGFIAPVVSPCRWAWSRYRKP